ncbi:FAD-dependent oxidoreductase [Alistipes sp.]|uniref:FAD-dependent oxidoreductase n=1 Tax=Alistipes sp. TaxID=1872444 RepID=UPI003AEFE459
MKQLIISLLLTAMASCVKSGYIFVEAELFENKGGWVVDAQFMDQMGSPYLMAHGLGKSVADAETFVKFPETGNYRIWVRTFNWNASWDVAKAPGVFQLLADDRVVAERLGDEPSEWDWQRAGVLDVTDTEVPVKISLHDLTGFDGRCDALFFTRNGRTVPPKDGSELDAFRKKMLGITPERSPERYDLIVVGAGTAGLSAAISASRLGLKTLLLQNRGVVGGNSSPEIGVTVTGGVKMGRYERVGNVIAELGIPFDHQQRILNILAAEENLTLLLNRHVIAAEKNGDAIVSVTAKDLTSGTETIYAGDFFADCTGDGNLGFLAGAEYMQGRETRAVFGETLAPEVESDLTFGSTLKWHAYTDSKAVDFPECPWAVQFTDVTCERVMRYQWYWESGFYKDQIKDAEFIRDYWFRVIFGNWAFLKNRSEVRDEYRNRGLHEVSYILGKRESRRLKGDYVITQNDVEGGWRKLPDAAVICTYMIDQHFPDPENAAFFPEEEFLALAKHNFNPLGKYDNAGPGIDINEPFMIPYRCLYSINIPNLFMAGRNISASRIALAALRIQATTAMMGEVVGMASVLCVRHGCEPRDVYEKYLNEFREMLKEGVPQKHEEILRMNIR